MSKDSDWTTTENMKTERHLNEIFKTFNCEIFG